METAFKPQTHFGRVLRAELARHPRINSIRKLGHEMRPEAPETARRAIAKWISGEARPTATSRYLVATALGVDPSVFSDPDDEEEDAEVRDLFRALMYRIDSVVEKRVDERLRELA